MNGLINKKKKKWMNVREGGKWEAVDGGGSFSYHKQRRGGELVSLVGWGKEKPLQISAPYHTH